MNKQQFRQECLRIRNQWPEAQRKCASDAITRHVLELPEFCHAHSVLIYVSLPMEVQTEAILQAAWQAGKTVLVPRCLAHHQMEAVPVKSMADLESGAYGIREPNASLMPSLVDPDLILVPCVAASASGGRIGYGGGYYDRYLKKHTGQAFGLCFEALICNTVPQTPLDYRLDGIITENRVIIPERPAQKLQPDQFS